MQKHLNSGVYKAGFADSQEMYDENVPYVFAALNKCEALVHANGGPYMLGKALTILDIQLYCTLIRFDVVYHQHFKCNLGMIRHDYPVLHAWMRNLYWNMGAFRDSTDFKHIKENVSDII
jgi:putative glutathione S-transferase